MKFFLFGGINILNNFFKLITDLFLFLPYFILKIMNFLGSLFFKLVIFCEKSFKSLNNNESIKKDKNNFNNGYTDYNDMFNEIMNENEFNNENKSNNKDNQSKNNNKPNKSFLKNIFSNIKNKLYINKDKDQELIFKELKNQFDSINKNNNQNNGPNNFNSVLESKNSPEKYSLNNIVNQSIQEIINIKIAIPLIIAILAGSTLLSYIFLSFEISLAIILIGLIGFFLIFYLPQMEKERKYSEISKELPYALRHMVTELKSGKGLHDTLNSIAVHDYGALSQEFSRVLEEVKYGENTENALISMSKRVSSNGLNRTVQQIIGTLRTGGNLSNTLSIIAEDITHDLQMELKDYSQKLNAFIMIYTFLAILGPVIFLIMLMAASTVMGDIIPSNVVLILYIFFFPMIVIFMGLMIKRLEPSV